MTSDGNGPLDFAVPGSGLNPAIAPDFTVGSASTCPQLPPTSESAQLAPGASCTDLVSFTPVTAASISGTLVTTDAALNVPGMTETVLVEGFRDNLLIPTLTFSVPDHTLGTPPFAVAAISNSPRAITSAVLSGPATETRSIVTLTGAGTALLLASQARSRNYVAETATATLKVAREPQTITFALLPRPSPRVHRR